MAENIGTLEYLLKINSEQAEKDLKDIEKLVKDQSSRVEQVFKKYGQNISDQGFETLKKKLASLKTEYEKLSLAGKGDSAVAQKKLAEIQQIESAVRVLNDAYKAQERSIKEVEAAAKRAAKEQLKSEKLYSTVRYNKLGTVGKVDAQIALAKFERSNATEIAEIDKLTKLINRLTEQKTRLIAKNRELQQVSIKAIAEQKLRAAISATEAGSIARLRAEYALMSFQLKNITKDTPNATAEINRLTGAMAQHRATIAQLQPTEGLWGKLKRAIVTYATAYLSVQGAIQSARVFFQQTKELDQLSFAMSTVIKNSAELAQTQKFLSDVAVNYGGDLLTLSERYIKFRAAAQQSNITATETQKIFDTVSKAAGTLGLKTDELSGVYLALEQMISKGKVTTEELRRQLGERLPGAFGIMANALGVTLPQLDKMLKKGEVLSKDALPKFAAALEKAYGIESLKKIDTLAAAQGRLSTETTALIKSFEASGEIKNFFNSLAGFVRYIREHIGFFKAFAKGIVEIAVAVSAYKLVLGLQLAVQKQMVYWTGRQIAGIAQLNVVQTEAIITARAAAGATTAWSNAFKTFGGWVGIAISLVASLAVGMGLFRSETKETADAMGELAKGEQKQLDILSRTEEILRLTASGTERYKNALQDVNVIASKYNVELLTEKSTREDINKTIEESIRLVKEDYAEKRKSVLLSREEEARAAAIDPLRERITRYFEEQGATDPTGRAIDQLKAFQDYVAKGYDAKQISELIVGGTLSNINLMLNKAIQAEKRYITETTKIRKLYPDKPSSEIFDIDELNRNIESAKDEFAKIEKIGKEKLAAPVISKDFETEKAYLESLLVTYKKFPEALEVINLRIAELNKDSKTGGKSTGKSFAEIQGEKLEAQIAIVNQLKKAYDDLRKIFGEGAAAKQLESIFGKEIAALGIDIDFDLTDEKYQKWGESMVVKADKIGGDVGKKIGESLSKSLNKNTVEGAVDTGKQILERFDGELDDFERKQAQRENIFDITGNDKLAINLSFNTDAIIDAEQFVKNRIIQLANELGQQDLFEGTFESMVANVEKFTPELQKKIEAVQKYLKEKQENMMLDAVKFMFTNMPEGQDIEFDFSNVVAKFDSAIKEINNNVKTFSESDLPAKLGLDEKDIERRKEIFINAVNEIAKNSVDKLGNSFIKDSLPEQLQNDFEDLEDASIKSLKKILAEIENMKAGLVSGDVTKSLFDATNLKEEDFKAQLDLVINTGDIETFLANIDKVKLQLAELEKNKPELAPSDEDVKKFQLFVDLLQKLGIGFKTASDEVSRSGFQKIAKDAKALQKDIDDVYDSVINLSEALGTGLSDRAKTTLNAIKDASVGIFGIIEGTAKLAAKEISNVEKASAILRVVSAVLKIYSAIQTAINKNNEETRQNELSLLKVAYEYNKALKERNVLLEQANTIFGTDQYGAALSFLVEMKEAQDDYAVSLEKIKKLNLFMHGPTDKKWWEFWKPIGGIIESDIKLIELYPDLIKDNVLNVEKATAILNDVNSGFTEEQKIILQEAVDAQERYKTALESFNDYLKSIFGNLGNDLMTAITDNLNATMDALDVFTDYASSALEKLFSDLAYSMYLAPIFKDLQEQVKNAYTDAIPDDATQILDIFKMVSPLITGGMEGASDFLKTIQDAAKLSGFDIFNKDTADQSVNAMRGEIKSVTEDTARRLEGLLNTVRETTVNNGKSMLSIAQSNEMIQAYAAQSVLHLGNIDRSTAGQLKILTEVIASASGTGGTGFKVYVQ